MASNLEPVSLDSPASLSAQYADVRALTVSLCGSRYNTRLAVYQTVCPPTVNLALVCNDDFCDEQSQVSFTTSRERPGSSGARRSQIQTARCSLVGFESPSMSLRSRWSRAS